MNRAVPSGLVLAVVLVSGCSGLAQAPPPAPSTADFDEFHARMLALTWAGFALPPSLDAPPVTPGVGFERAAWGAALRACMKDAGYPDFGYTFSNEAGYVLLTVRRETVLDPSQQVTFYFCAARHPLLPDERRLLVGAGQLNYVYDYYLRWTVPCLIDHGYKLRRILSREQFVAASGQWVPYWELPMYSAADHERVIGLCGPDRPPLSAGS